MGLAAAAYATYVARAGAPQGDARSDFDHLWAAARMCWAGIDPYEAIGPAGPFHYPWRLFYPLTTVLAAMPLAALPLELARAAFVGGAAALLAWHLAAKDVWPLGWMFGAAMIDAVGASQWSPLTTAAALAGPTALFLPLKPTHAAVWLAATERPALWRWAAAAGAALGVVSLVVDPGWPLRWLAAVAAGHHFRVLAARPLGALVLVALVRWRRAEARLLMALCCVPVTPSMYEMVPLGLVPRTPREMLVLLASGGVGQLVQPLLVDRAQVPQRPDVAADVLVAAFVLPALVMVLRRPNEGAPPAWWSAVRRPRWRVPDMSTAPQVLARPDDAAPMRP